jgi:hypothetical protein
MTSKRHSVRFPPFHQDTIHEHFLTLMAPMCMNKCKGVYKYPHPQEIMQHGWKDLRKTSLNRRRKQH